MCDGSAVSSCRGSGWVLGLVLGVGLSSADQCVFADTARQYYLGFAPDSPTRSLTRSANDRLHERVGARLTACARYSVCGLARVPGANTIFTSVGYGTQKSNPAQEVALLIRESAQPHLTAINPPVVGHILMILSNNAASGGTCFGDSGGPNYLGTSHVIAAITTFGRSPTCGGNGGVFRVDQQDVIDFVSGFLN